MLICISPLRTKTPSEARVACVVVSAFPPVGDERLADAAQGDRDLAEALRSAGPLVNLPALPAGREDVLACDIRVDVNS